MSNEVFPMQVVATAGHVDHGKSSLIRALTGIDPDRFEEEKRRGLTIDLGFAWCRLPSGREVGFVDVPGHERFVRNMLAGVGPVRLVLFVVAADEGWKPQTEEHLEIVDTLGVHGAVVALTKCDLVDERVLRSRRLEIATKVRGTDLESAGVVPVSAATGTGIDALRAALDEMIEQAPPPDDAGRPRLSVDRVFMIKGAGTVVTGTLTGGRLRRGDDVVIHPTGAHARVRGLQTHKRELQEAAPVSRVAVNLAGIDRAELMRGNVIGLPGHWRDTRTLEARILPVRSLDHELASRGAYKLHSGSAERDARVRFLEGPYARIRLAEPLALAVFDRFVLREMGRRETVAGGIVLDLDPPLKPGRDARARLAARERASREELAAILVSERGSVRDADIEPLTGARVDDIEGADRIGDWWVSAALRQRLSLVVSDAIGGFHASHPLAPGADLAAVRTWLSDAVAAQGRATAIAQVFIDDLVTRGAIVRDGNTIRLPEHSVELPSEGSTPLVRAVSEGEPTPPTIPELTASGFPRDLIAASIASGALVRVSPEMVMTPGFVAGARRILEEKAAGGITVSAFREAVGTTRRYALPLLEYFDHQGVTVRRGDIRILRDR